MKEKRAFHGVADLQQQNEGGSPGLVVEEEAHNKEVVCSNPTKTEKEAGRTHIWGVECRLQCDQMARSRV